MTARAYILSARFGRLTSPGLWALNGWLESQGIPTEVHGSMMWDNLEVPIHKAKYEDPSLQIILIGYSLGGMRACDLANKLAAFNRNVWIDLLVTLVPPRRYLSWNVRRALNHTVKGGHWSSDYLYDAHGREVKHIENVNHFSVLGITHYTIQFLPSVHASIHKTVKEVVK